MSTLALKEIVHPSTGLTTINGHTPTVSNMMGKNKLINGNFDVWQRGTVFTATAGASTYTADRWIVYAAGATMYPYQGVIANGSKYGLAVNGQASNTATTFVQRIESTNFQVPDGTKFTVSAKVFSTVSRTIAVFCQTAGSVDNFTTATVLPGATNVMLSAGINTVSVTFESTAACRNGLQVEFAFGAVTSGTVWISQAQLELGSVATTFEDRPIGIETMLCQRYYWTTGVTNNGVWGAGQAFGTSAGGYLLTLPTNLRTTPTVTVQRLYGTHAGGGITLATAAAATFLPHNRFYIFLAGMSSLTAGHGSLLVVGEGTNTGFINVSAEL